MSSFRLHPIHMMMIHFPSALLPMDLLFSVIAVFYSNNDLAIASYYCLIAGTIGGWLAVISGMIDLFKYILKKADAIKPGFIHAGIQTFAITGFTVLLGMEIKNHGYILTPPAWLWITKAILLIVMLAGNYLGGELLMKYVVKQLKNSRI